MIAVEKLTIYTRQERKAIAQSDPISKQLHPSSYSKDLALNENIFEFASTHAIPSLHVDTDLPSPK